MKNKKSKILPYFGIFLLLVFLDQALKYLIRRPPACGGGFYICNRGISWGIQINSYVFALFWIVIVLFLTFLFFRPSLIHNSQFTICKNISIPKFQILNLAIVFILAGAISNAIDRMFLGCVVDFIDLKFWPIFNLADVFIVAGAIFVLVGWRKV